MEITESSVLSAWASSRFRPVLQKENQVSGLLRGEDGDFLNLGAHSLASTAALPSGGNPVGFFHTGSFLSILLFHEFLTLWMKGLISSSEWKFCLLLFGHCVQSHWQWFPSPPWLPFLSFSVSSKNVPFIFTNKLEHCFLWEYSLVL